MIHPFNYGDTGLMRIIHFGKYSRGHWTDLRVSKLIFIKYSEQHSFNGGESLDPLKILLQEFYPKLFIHAFYLCQITLPVSNFLMTTS